MLKIKPKNKFDLSNLFFFDNKKYISSSLSIIKNPNDDKQYILMVRYNYKIQNGSKTINFVKLIDKNFNLINEQLINYDFKLENSREGIEDIKLFTYENEIYYIGTYKHNNIDKISSNKFLIDNIGDELVENIINVDFKTTNINEKNWVFFKYKSNLCVIYKWFPLQICYINYEDKKLIKLQEKDMPYCFQQIRGSSCGILYDNMIWFLVHHTDYINESIGHRKYSHKFVVFNEDMDLIKYSEYFYFEQDREFSYGFLIDNNEFLLGYSTDNSTSKIIILDYNYIINDIKWIYIK